MASEEEVVIDLSKMKIPELKKELQHRGLKISGNKHDLIERLQQYLEEHEGAEVADDEILKEEDGEIDDNYLTDDKKLDDTNEDSVLAVQAESKAKALTENKDKKTDDEATKPQAEEKTAPTVTAVKSPTGLTDKEKLELRAKKFGMSVTDMNMDARKAARSDRFGSGAISKNVAADPDKLKSRAERFGAVVSESLSKSEEEERRKKRQARFGGGISTDGAGEVSDEKKRKRAERFGLSVA